MQHKKLQRVKDVEYNMKTGKITKIPGLKWEPTKNKFTLTLSNQIALHIILPPNMHDFQLESLDFPSTIPNSAKHSFSRSSPRTPYCLSLEGLTIVVKLSTFSSTSCQMSPRIPPIFASSFSGDHSGWKTVSALKRCPWKFWRRWKMVNDVILSPSRFLQLPQLLTVKDEEGDTW